jgi:DMSO/TMAO reductase YedYZ molybdopterin-dependent catalytic subunit
MKKLLFPFITIALIGITLGTSILAFSTPTAQAASTSETRWRLSINGLVKNPLNLTLANLAAMPQTTIEADIRCVDFPTEIVAGGKWTGVNLRFLLDEAGVSSSAIKVAFYAADGYSTDLDLETANRETVIIAYERDGQPLSETLRLVVPGKWGYKWISQLIDIVLVDYDFKGKYESQGYSDEANIEINANRPPTQTQTTPPSQTSGQPSELTTPTSPSTTQPSNSSSPASSEEIQNPRLEAVNQNFGSFPQTWLILAIAAVVAGACLLVYVKKRHK